MNIYIVLLILFIHWVADFVLQTDYQARNKSSKIMALLGHTLSYSLFFTVFIWFVLLFVEHSPMKLLYFPVITFVLHTITDYFTSRINKKLWEEKKVHKFFVSIGFDQFLHFTQLLITYKLLTC